MADEKVTTILDVQLDAGKVAQDLQDLVTRIAALKAQQKELNEQIRAGNDIDGKYAEQLIRVKDQLSWTEKQAKGLSATTKLLNADTLTYSDSLNGQRQKLADMQKAYDQLDKAQRESEGGKAFLASIKAQHDAVLGMEEATGRAQRNVGNYSKSIIDAIPIGGKFGGMLKSTAAEAVAGGGGFKALANGIKLAMTAGLKFIATPIGLVLAAIALAVGGLVKAFQKVTEAFKKNDDAMTALTKAFAIFKPIGEAISAVFDNIAKGLAAVATAAANAVSWIVGKLAPGYAAAAKDAQDLVQAQDDLEEAERNYTVNSAQRNAKVAELRDKAVQSEKYSAEERKKFLQEAIALEQQNLEDQKKIAAERLRILEAEAKQNKDTSDETKNRIAQARAAMYQAEEQYYSGVRRLNSQLTAFDKEEQQKRTEATKAALARRAELKKQAEEEERQRVKNSEEIAQMAEDFSLSLIKDETTRRIAEYQVRGVREIEQLKKRLTTEKNLTDESREQLAQIIKDKTNKLNEDLATMSAEAAEAMSDEEYTREQERAQRLLNLRLQLAEEGSQTELELQKQLLEMQMQQELENTELNEEEKELIRDTYRKRASDLDKQYYDKLKKEVADAKEFMKSQYMEVGKAASSLFSNLSSLLGEYAEDNEEAAAAQKAFGLTSIIVDQAMSIASGAQAIAAAMAGAAEAAAATGPAAPFTLIAFQAQMVSQVIALMASVASTIVQAKQLFGQAGGNDAGKYAGGGTIPGTSYTGDRLIAHVNSGEGVYTGTQANNLLQEIANNPARGGFDMEGYAAATAAAVAALPAPVVVYSEMREFEQRVTNYDEIARI